MSNESNSDRRTLMERSVPGRVGAILPDLDVPAQPLPHSEMLREDLRLPELSEPEVVRYFTNLSHLNYSIDTNFYPLGSCSMKYNPKINDEMAFLPGFAAIHPLQSHDTAQGALKLMYILQQYLAEITGMDGAGLAPLAGAQGEFCGMLMIRAYHRERGETRRTKVAIPDSAHGTNPASAAMAGFQVVTVASDSKGNIDLQALNEVANQDLAGVMITQPNTLGLFDTQHLGSVRGSAQGWRVGIRRRRQYERPVGKGKASPAGVRRGASKPPQDLHDPPRRRRSRRRPRIRQPDPPPLPPIAGGQSPGGRRRGDLLSLDFRKEVSARFAGFTATSECWSGRTRTSVPWVIPGYRRSAPTPC